MPTARQISDHLHCDDTSARHRGKSAVCTHIGNELFASFTTTDSKSRLNFLRLLCQPREPYRVQPTEDARYDIASRFDRLCLSKTGYPDLNDALRLLHAKRAEFLAVLEYPHLPLHNNLAENDIREYARIRKISAGTRSNLGRRCRDTFLSLKKTCRKLGVSFREYLLDRLARTDAIPRLSELMRLAADAGLGAAPAPAPQSG